MSKLWKLVSSGAFVGTLLTGLGAMDFSQVVPLVPPKWGAVLLVTGMVVTAFSRALHEALTEEDKPVA